MKKTDNSWIVTIASLTLISILYIPTVYDGVCITVGEQKETIGVCTRQWMQSIGPILLSIVAIVVGYKFSTRQESKMIHDTYRQLRNEIRVLFFDLMEKYHQYHSFLEKSLNSTSEVEFHRNLRQALEILHGCLRMTTIDTTGINDIEYKESRERFIIGLGSIINISSSIYSQNKTITDSKQQLRDASENFSFLYNKYSDVLFRRSEACNKYLSHTEQII